MSEVSGGTVAGAERRRTVLDPIERSSEVLFGLIMVLSFTGTISIAIAEQDPRAGARRSLIWSARSTQPAWASSTRSCTC
jgi:hypothetical protein